MESRECPYCHKKISLKRCSKYMLKGTKDTTTCDKCGNEVKLIREPIPFIYCVWWGILCGYLPIQFYLYVCDFSFMKSVLCTLPLALILFIGIAIGTFRNMYFEQT